MSDFTPRYLSDYAEADFKINTVDLTFELNEQKTKVTSVMALTHHGSGDNTLVLDGEHLTLLSLELNGKLLTEDGYLVTDSGLEILAMPAQSCLKIVTEIDPLNNTTLEGLFKSGNAYCTQCEAEGFRRMTYYLDRPDVMATFTTTIIANKANYPHLLSNGNKIDQGEIEGGQHFVKWHDPFPKPCYLFALVAGDFDVLADKFVTASKREVTLEIYVDKGNVEKAHHAMVSLKNSMAWDEQTFGLEYDLDIYMIVAVDFFNMGAMENKGLNVFNSKFVLADEKSATDTDYFNIEAVIAHEYFHNWTGNRVTCRDWFQLSLKEGLTVFRDQQFSADMHSAAVNRIQNVRVLRSLQFAEDAGPMSHPIRPEKVLEMNNFYTLTVYEKGAEVIRMIHTLLGSDKFRQGMDLYFKRFDGMAVTCDDFINAMADASQVDLEQFKRWYSQAGTPQLQVVEKFQPSSGNYTLTISQNNADNSALFMPICIELIDDKSQVSSRHLLTLKQAEQTWSFDGYQQQPVLALLSGFSAPVKVDFTQTDQALQVIMTQAKDDFCRWDAGQKLLTVHIHNLLANPDFVVPDSVFIAFEKIINSADADAFKAEQLTLPSFDELADAIEEVNPIALLDAIETLKLALAQKLALHFNAQYKNCLQASYSNTAQAIGKRALKNICLSYLCLTPSHHHLLKEQFRQADNMTDSLAALQTAAKNNATCFNELKSSFATRWSDTPLVMDKWFAISASNNDQSIYEQLAKLVQHPLFSLTNPNRARALIGAFAATNPRYFHSACGKGYQFLAAQVTLLNDINPQVASRLITPLIQFKGLDKTRQTQIRALLVELHARENLSKDLKEKLDAALANS